MKIGVPKEIKPQENRIGLTPESVKTLVSEGHEVIVENKPPYGKLVTTRSAAAYKAAAAYPENNQASQ